MGRDDGLQAFDAKDAIVMLSDALTAEVAAADGATAGGLTKLVVKAALMDGGGGHVPSAWLSGISEVTSGGGVCVDRLCNHKITRPTHPQTRNQDRSATRTILNAGVFTKPCVFPGFRPFHAKSIPK